MKQITIKLDAATVARIDAIAEHYSAALGTSLVRTDAVRMVASKGLDAIEAEIGAAKKSAKK